jgi:hypothetical protein
MPARAGFSGGSIPRPAFSAWGLVRPPAEAALAGCGGGFAGGKKPGREGADAKFGAWHQKEKKLHFFSNFFEFYSKKQDFFMKA